MFAEAPVGHQRDGMSKQILPRTEIRFHPASHQDEAGRIFYWRDELFRGISPQSGPFLTNFVQGGAMQKLVRDKLLIETEITPYETEGFPVVLRHRRLPFVSYPFEWPGPMLKAAALLVIDLAISLAGSDLMLKDAHFWNVLFDGPRPVWIDLPSIVARAGNEQWPAAAEFHDECVYPLILMSQRRESLARWLVSQDNGVPHAELETLDLSRSMGAGIATLARRHLPQRPRAILNKALHPLRLLWPKKVTEDDAPVSFLPQLDELKAEVKSIPLSFAGPGAAHPSAEPGRDWNAKQLGVQKVLSRVRPQTVLDIASGSGWFSELAAHFAGQVVAFDIDPKAAAQLFASAHARSLPILPLVMDFTRPTPACGLANHSHIAALERFPCEMVLMLGFLHELVFKYRRLGLNEICDGLAAFSKRWVVVEFIPGDDPQVAEFQSDWFADYTIENFTKALRRHFPKIETYPSEPASRVLIVGEK